MKVGVLRITFMIRSAASLKEKRQVLRSLKDRLASRFNVAVAEVGANEKWQLGELGIATVGNEARFVSKSIQNVRSFLAQDPRISIIEAEMEVL
jgi:hypothetical protein